MIGGVKRYVGRHHVALLALFVGLSGTAFAAANTLVPLNSVGSPQVINGSLKTVDLSKSARSGLRGARGAAGPQGGPGSQGAAGPQGTAGAQGAQGAAGAQGATGLPGPSGPQGPAGMQGATGSQGPTGPSGASGPRGPAGFSSLHYVTSDPIDLPHGEQAPGHATCDTGLYPVGGGALLQGGVAEATEINSSYPSDQTGGATPPIDSWYVWADNHGTTNEQFTVYVVCAPASDVTGPSTRTTLHK